MKMQVRIGNTSRLKQSIKKKIESVVNSKKFQQEVAEEIVFDIQRNARSGNIIVNGQSRPMAPLRPISVDHRKYLREGGNATARPYRDAFSNLSMSGQLIDSIKYFLKGNTIVIMAKGARTRYMTKKGRPSKAQPISNEELSAIHHKGNPGQNLPARPIIGLRTQMKQRIFTKLKEYLRRGFLK